MSDDLHPVSEPKTGIVRDSRAQSWDSSQIWDDEQPWDGDTGPTKAIIGQGQARLQQEADVR